MYVPHRSVLLECLRRLSKADILNANRVLATALAPSLEVTSPMSTGDIASSSALVFQSSATSPSFSCFEKISNQVRSHCHETAFAVGACNQAFQSWTSAERFSLFSEADSSSSELRGAVPLILGRLRQSWSVWLQVRSFLSPFSSTNICLNPAA